MAKKILVIDDDDSILEAFQAILESAGYDVETSLNGDVLSTLSKGHLPDLIVLDVLLSGVDGRDLCRGLRAQKETRNVPIIMVSAHPSAGKSVKEIGANDFLAKPFDMDDFLSRVKKYTD